MREMTLLMLIVHVAADYQLQTEGMARRKAEGAAGLLWHAPVVLALHALLLLVDITALPLLAALAGAHIAVDGLKLLLGRGIAAKLPSTKGDPARAWLYVLDQLAHIALIIFLPRAFALQPPAPPAWMTVPLLQGALLVTLNLKPANITFKQLFGPFAPSGARAEEEHSATRPGAGALIGGLERLISLLLLSVQQYAAIGLILTAKSIARYDRISKDQQFAEYYLIGTLFSVLWAVGSYLLVTLAL